uniref:Nuclear fragile X mental retardation interacting n=1 Tax=Echinococcus granulosus TaxID=6210 RepID=A0A068WR94_ECHGR|nr:nuclear fragile X mental retardation interacting [Echinococcus granulosus]
MELPDFSSLWEASSTLEKLQESLLKDYSPRNRVNAQDHRRRDPDSYNNYYSDGICGVSFGIAEPEFANPLATCCEQHFFTAEELDRHTAEHVVCPGIPGMEGSSCGHSIHPSAIAFHLETEHATANSAADTKGDAEHNGPALKRWREARRRNYPTFERVQAKIREVGYRIDRGQVLLTRKFGSLNSRKPRELRKPRDESNKRPKLQANCANILSSQQTQPPPLPQRANAKSRLNYPPALDNLELATNSGDVGRPTPFVEDVEGTPEVGIDLPTVRGNEDEESPSVPTPIPRPLVSYDSDVSWSEQLEEIEEIEPPASSSAKKTLLEQLETVQPKNAQEEDTHGDPQTTLSSNTSKERRIGRPKRDKRGRRRRERRDRARSDAEDENEPTTSTAADDGEVEIDEVSAKGGVKAFAAHPLVQMFARRRACMRHASLISKRPTLLQMLLAEEMRHERNQLMQCVRFVVKNNFFLSE